MKKAVFLIFFLFVFIASVAETLEHGSVKEYHGSDAKTALPGVELQVKGAQSAVSDSDGSFVLHFATLKPGEKVNYTDIYKDGYVIFNKDALDAWRISNNERPFVIVMCKESDFRALKKKFYGIIEKSYYEEYLRQRELASKTSVTAQQLEAKLRDVEKEYQQKMSNINTYVEMFSRIDRNEMDSIEAKALKYMENEQIAEAIKTYEELHLRKEMQSQFSKWDAAEEMRRAANGMESEAQADLLALVDKMQKQISLYEMGGYEYDIKRFEMMGDLIALLYRLRPVTGDYYNETLGELIVNKANWTYSYNREAAFREAAALPSVAGLKELARQFQIMLPTEERIDTIRGLYSKALHLLANKNDSVKALLQDELALIPDGFYNHTDGNKYPYRLLPDNEALLVGRGPWFSTHIEGNVELPSYLYVDENRYTVVGLGKFSFGKNKKLRSIKLPQYCRYIDVDAFKGCDSLAVIVNPELEEIRSEHASETIPKNATLYIPEIPKNIEWLNNWVSILEPSDTTHNARELTWALTRYYQNKGDYEMAINGYNYIINLYIAENNLSAAKKHAKEVASFDKKHAEYYFSHIYEAEGDYKNALKSASKGLTDNFPYTYNEAAYMYGNPKYGKPDMVKAHNLIDKAIALARDDLEKANFTDSKGELYLMEGKVDKAKEYLDLALSIYPEYILNATSKLHSYFYPEYEKDNLQQDEEAQLNEENNRLQRIRNMSVALMARDFLTPRLKDAPGAELNLLDNMVSQFALLSSNGDESNAQVISLFIMALRTVGENLYSYCLGHEIPFNNEWVALIDIDDTAGLDKTVQSAIWVMMATYQMGKRLPVVGLFDENVELIYKLQKGIENYINLHTGIERDVIQAFIDGYDVAYIKDSFGYDNDKIASLASDLYASVMNFYSTANDNELGIIPYSGDAEDSEIIAIIEKSDASKAKKSLQIKTYIDLLQRVARIAYSELPQWDNFKVMDYEELVAIGVIAVNVLTKNKTDEQLDKYNELYIATAIMWAIKNELKIRYQWYNRLNVSGMDDKYRIDLAKQYEAAGMDYNKGQVRMAVYMVLALVGRTYEQPNNGKINVLKDGDINVEETQSYKMWQVVKNCRNDLSEKYHDCYDAYIAPDFNFSKFQEQFSPVIINGMFTEIKDLLNKNGVVGY